MSDTKPKTEIEQQALDTLLKYLNLDDMVRTRYPLPSDLLDRARALQKERARRYRVVVETGIPDRITVVDTQLADMKVGTFFNYDRASIVASLLNDWVRRGCPTQWETL